jgi:hypothetical protein
MQKKLSEGEAERLEVKVELVRQTPSRILDGVNTKRIHARNKDQVSTFLDLLEKGIQARGRPITCSPQRSKNHAHSFLL